MSDVPGRRTILEGSAWVFGASMLFNLCGFAFHAVALRKLGPEDYGALYALLSAATVAALPAGVLIAVVARFAAEFRALRDDSHIRGLAAGLTRIFGVLAIVYVVVAAVGARPLSTFLHVPAWTIPFCGIAAGLTMLSGTLRAVAVGTQDFRAYAVSTTAEGIAKVVSVAILATLALLGGLSAYICGVICGAIAIVWSLVRRYAATPDAKVHYDWQRIAASLGGSAALIVTITIMSNLDAVIVKHSFDAHAAGIYSAASIGGKILFYLVGFIPTVLLPHATDRHARGESAMRPLLTALGILFAFALVGLLAFALGGRILLPLLAGGSYDAALPLLTWYGIAMVFLALTNALATFGIATHRLAFSMPLVAGAVGTIGAIALWHPSLQTVVQTLLIGNVLTAAGAACALAIQGARGHGREALPV